MNHASGRHSFFFVFEVGFSCPFLSTLLSSDTILPRWGFYDGGTGAGSLEECGFVTFDPEYKILLMNMVLFIYRHICLGGSLVVK